MISKELYRNYLLQLQDLYSLQEATVITDWVFESIAQISRADLIKNPGLNLSENSKAQLQSAFQQLMQHRPVQYVLGLAWFYRLAFKVNEQVLIPRPETEELVNLVIGLRKSLLTDPAILDIGTGSGCIPIALKKHMPAARVSSIDISKHALSLATENAHTHNTDIHFIEMDFLDESKWGTLPDFDIIVSNPPYIPESEKQLIAPNVLAYEPHAALFVPDNDPLLFYKKIAAFAQTHLKPNGSICMEIHENFSDAVAELFKQSYPQVVIKQDGYGKNRMILVTT